MSEETAERAPGRHEDVPQELRGQRVQPHQRRWEQPEEGGAEHERGERDDRRDQDEARVRGQKIVP